MFNKSQSRLFLVVSGDSKEELDKLYGPNIWRLLSDNGFADRKSIGAVGFCRNLDENQLVVVFPKAFGSNYSRSVKLDKEKINNSLYQLIRVFNKIGRETNYKKSFIKTNSLADKLLDASDPVLDSLEAAIKLRNDFKVNGLYYRKKKNHDFSKENLPINWSKTINQSQPQLNDDGIFFNRTTHNSRKRSLYHPLSSLHMACLKEIFTLTGDKTYLGMISEFTYSSVKPALKNPKKYIGSICNDIFDERGQRLKKLIITYLGDGRLSSGNLVQKDEVLTYTAEFENIWEYILRELFDSSNHSRDLAAGRWFNYAEVPEEKSGIKPEIDMKISSGDINAFIDAKDYRVINGARHGSSNDYYKQVIYRLLTETKTPENFFNILVFPEYGQNELFKIYGCHDWNEISNSRVFEIGVDYEIAVSRWLGESKLNVEASIKKLLQDLKSFESLVGNPRHLSPRKIQ